MRWRRSPLAAMMLILALSPGLGAATAETSSWLYQAWQTDRGLPDNSVTGVGQTRDGYLWVATLGGLMVFNGASFKVVPTLNLPEVPNRVVRALFVDHQDRVWLGMDRGILACLGKNTARTYSTRDGLLGTRAAAMAEDGEGALWIAFASGLCRIKEERITAFDSSAGLPAAGGSTCVASDSKGVLWFSRGAHLGVVRDGKPQTVTTFRQTPIRICRAASATIWISAGPRLLKYTAGKEPEELARLPENAQARVLFEDRSGALWIGTAANGLFRLESGRLEPVPTAHEEVNCLSQDQEGNIWAGTAGGGLNLLRPRVAELIGLQAGLPFESVRSVCEDAQGQIWVALQNGVLALRREAKWSRAEVSAGWSGGDATCVAADRQDGVWVGTRDRGLQCLRNGRWSPWRRRDGLSSDSVRSILVASNNDVWIATDSPRQLHQLREGSVSALPAPGEVGTIRAMTEGADGTIWIGTSGGRILRADHHGLVDETAATGPRELSVRCLHATTDGALWIGYAGYGVGRLRQGHYSRITTREGLMDDFVSHLLSDTNGTMWLTGNHGLFQARMADLEAVYSGRSERLRSRVFGRSEDLAVMQTSFDYSPSACRGRDGRLWFAMRNGLLMVQPDKVGEHPDPPPVLLERVNVDDYPVALYASHSPSQTRKLESLLDLSAPGGLLRLQPGHRKVEFEFAALSFSSPENVHFRYRLDNFDDNWIETTSERRALYPRLPAGDYQFRVLACSSAGIWSEAGVVLPVVVSPFFWQTWWFRVAAVALFTAAVILFGRYVSLRRMRERMRQLEQQAALEKERLRIARDMHDEVGAKLTRLSFLSDMATSSSRIPSTAAEEVREMSETAREAIRSFEEIVWAVNPRNDTLADLAHYLCRYAEEFFEGSPVRCAFDLPPEIPAVTLPTEARHQIFLAAKEALNNVLKHARAQRASIRVSLVEDGFEVVIEDDGCGFDSQAPMKRAGGGNGLENMRDRLRNIGGQFECRSQPGQGTRIILRVAVKIASRK